MKNKMLLLVLFILSADISMAQNPYRYIDLACKIHSPIEGQYIVSPTMLDISYWVKNYGPDTVYAADTFDVFVTVHSAFYGFNTRYLAIEGVRLNPGDSTLVIFKHELDHDKDELMKFDVKVGLHNRSVNYLFMHESSGSSTSANNTSSVTINHRSANSNSPDIPVQKFEIFPNPAKDYFYLKFESTISKLLLKDATGKSIEILPSDIYFESDKTWRIHLPSNISNGIYWLELHSHSGIKVEKLAIQK